VPEAVVTRFIQDIISFDRWTVIGLDPGTMMDAISIGGKYSLHFWNALIVSTMKQHTLCTIYTEDSQFKKIPWIPVIDPLAGQRSIST